VFDPGNMRHRCRNPRCRGKLETPAENAHDAFCCRGCYAGFYRTRCLVCEESIVRPASNQFLCGRRKCRNDFRRDPSRYLSGRYRDAGLRHSNSKNSIKSKAIWQIESSEAWQIVKRVEAKNRALLEAAEIEAAGEFTEPEWREVISADGVRCFVTRFRDPAPPPRRASTTAPHLTIPDDLSIPDFLRRNT
jgi:hypothetical protein